MSRHKEVDETLCEVETRVTQYTSEEVKRLLKKLDNEINRTNAVFRVDFKDINTKYDCMSNSLKFDLDAISKKLNENMESLQRQLENVRYLNS